MSDQLVILFFALGLIIFFAAIIWSFFNKSEQRQNDIEALYVFKKQRNDLPRRYLPFSRFKYEISEERLEEAEVLYLALLEESETGKLIYSSSDLIRWMTSYRTLGMMTLFYKKHPVITWIIVILFTPIGWIPAIIGLIIFQLHKVQAGKMETAFNMYLNQTAQGQAKSSFSPLASSLADEIRKLDEMRASGILTDSEFSKLKSKLIA